MRVLNNGTMRNGWIWGAVSIQLTEKLDVGSKKNGTLLDLALERLKCT